MKGVFYCVFFWSFLLQSQVGVGTTEPAAQLDITASDPTNPSNIDGILVPRVEKFPSTKPGNDQHGMLVFLSKTQGEYPTGFYYWHQKEAGWKSIVADVKSADFYEENTTQSPGNIDDPIFRKGNIGIGTEEINSKLQIAINPGEDLNIKKGLQIDNNNSETDKLTTYGLLSENRSSTDGTKYGIKTKVAGAGSGIHYGIHNVTNQNTGTNDIYGIYNRVGRTYGAKSDNFGIYSEIGTTTGSGNIYGIYSKALGDRNANVFAGYFAGRLGIGKTPQDEYVLPETRGEKDQILVSDASGEMQWEFNNRKNYTSTGGTSGNYTIPDEVYSLRITNSPSTITLPDASSNKGRILILIGWQGSGETTLGFLNGDTLFDLETGTNITAVAHKERLMILSIGTRWLLLYR